MKPYTNQSAEGEKGGGGGVSSFCTANWLPNRIMAQINAAGQERYTDDLAPLGCSTNTVAPGDLSHHTLLLTGYGDVYFTSTKQFM